MKLSACVGCELPVLELEGQFEFLDSLFVSGGEPPERNSVGPFSKQRRRDIEDRVTGSFGAMDRDGSRLSGGRLKSAKAFVEESFANLRALENRFVSEEGHR